MTHIQYVNVCSALHYETRDGTDGLSTLYKQGPASFMVDDSAVVFVAFQKKCHQHAISVRKPSVCACETNLFWSNTVELKLSMNSLGYLYP